MRFFEFKNIDKKPLVEGAEARIQHAEDLVIFKGSKGATEALEGLRSLEQGGHEDVTIKWDGSPAIIFGRDANGEFILTDKSGWGAKGYNGRAKSAKEIKQMLMNRPGANNPDPVKRDDYRAFVGNMTDIFDEYEKAVPKDFVGFFKGDLLYYNTPPVEDGRITFTPNIVTYKVKPESEIGKRILGSKTAVVVHNMIDENGADKPLPQNVGDMFIGNEVFIVPPVTVARAPEVNDPRIDGLKANISKSAMLIDRLVDKPTLQQKQISGLSDVFYNYINSKVDTGLDNLGADFMQWLETKKQISNRMKQNIAAHISENKQGFDAMWQIVTDIQEIKNNVISQFDEHDHDVEAFINGQEGGEGYVLAGPQGTMKLVNRAGFTAANRAVQR